MKQQTCCFTGHRVIAPEHVPVLEKQLRAQILQLFDDGYRVFACGGALGFDTMAAQAVLSKHPHPTEEEVREGLSGNLCRCTGYNAIVNAVLNAAKEGEGLW